MLKGKVRWYNKKKGYGFVKLVDEDVFIHHLEIKDKRYRPSENDVISFDVVSGEKGLKAKNIIKVG